MFDQLSTHLETIFNGLKRQGVLSKKNIDTGLQQVRRALLEADVSLPVVKEFIAQASQQAEGQKVINSITPGQQIVKILHDRMVKLLGSQRQGLSLDAPAPVVIMMLGLQGSGKTTTTAKIARWISHKEKQKVLMASLDIHRPAAREQLQTLAEQNNLNALAIIPKESVLAIAKRAMEEAKLGGYDVLLLDSAGRLHIDAELMAESQAVCQLCNPHEKLLVMDSLTGQDAVRTATAFHEKLTLTGSVFTRVDGDSRGGAVLSMRAVTHVPITFLGVGEKIDQLEEFYPERMAKRILGMGDVVSLVEKATAVADEKSLEKQNARIKKGLFDLNDLAAQLKQMRKMGGIKQLMQLLPGMKKMGATAKLDSKILIRQEAILSSMTSHERANPKVLNAKRKKRVAAGSGMRVQDVNVLLKMHRQLSDMMKKMGKNPQASAQMLADTPSQEASASPLMSELSMEKNPLSTLSLQNLTKKE